MEETIPESTITTMPYLKWGAQKRLRCMKVQEGRRLSRKGRLALRPKRRPKYIQKKINRLLPGGWLPEINPSAYEVREGL
ncbi:hypothetical protein AMTRI_Chr01g108160 [Amborella trichopoda]